MRVLVTGGSGMLARELVPCLTRAGHTAFAPTHNDLDITSLRTVRATVDLYRPDIIINCTAYTKVDQAEREERLAMLVNGLAVQNLCLACQEQNVPLVHFSSDYVFDGTKDCPYTVCDRPNPINAYGRSKLLGEEYVRWLLQKFYLVRTSWLFGLHGPNFVETMLHLAESRDQLSVVNDQRGCPTWTRHLAEATVSLVASGSYGVYHVTNSEPTTWFDYAKEVFRLSGKSTKLVPISTEQFEAAARRPKNNVLDHFPLPEVIHREMPSWRVALQEYLSLRKERAQS